MTHLFKKGYIKVKSKEIPEGYFETFRNGRFCIVSAEDRPKSFKELKGFLECNGGRDCFSKWGGDVYMITIEGTWSKVCRCLPDLSFSQYLYLSR